MKVDWENIKYIFQIPIGWYQDINNKVEHAYGQNFITLREGYDGGLEIGVDEEMFSEYVQRYITGGTVKSVDGIPPDDSGNVILNAVRTINGDGPDDEGNIEFNAVMSINDVTPDEDGNVDIDAVFTVNNISPDEDGNVNVGTVKSVNNTPPDENGNVNIETGGTVKSVDFIQPDDNGNVVLNAIQTSDVGDAGIIAGLDYEGEYSVAPMAHGHKVSDLDDIQDEQGNWMFVKSINTTITPDENGNVNLPLPSGEGYLVTSVDGVKATDEKGNVDLKAVRSIQTGDKEEDKHFPDANGNIKLDVVDGKVKTVNQVEPDDDGNIDLGNIVYSVNDVAADADGNVVLDIPTKLSDLPNDAGYTTTTNVQNIIGERLGTLTHEDITDWASATYSFLDVLDVADLGVIAGPNYEDEKYICPVNHNHNFEELLDWEDTLNEKYVTLDTEQTITGAKTFTQSILVSSDGGTRNGVQINPSGIIELHGGPTGLNLRNSNGTLMSGFTELNTGTSLFSLGDLLISSENANGSVYIKAPQNRSILDNSPSDDCQISNAIATVGWVRKNGGAVKSVNGNTPDADGNIELDIPTNVSDLTNDAGYTTTTNVTNIINNRLGNLTHTDITDWNTATSSFVEFTDVADLGVTAGLDYTGDKPVCPTNHGHKASDITDLNGKFVTIDTVQTVNGTKTFANQLQVGVPTSTAPTTVYGPGRVELFGATPYIDFHYGNSTADYTDRIIAGNTFIEMKADGNRNVILGAAADKVILRNNPSASTSTTSNIVATVGWCNSNLGRVKKVNNTAPDANGNVTVGTVRSVNNTAPDANGNVTIQAGTGKVNSVDNKAPDSSGNVQLNAITSEKIATPGSIVSPDVSYEKTVCPTQHGHNHDAIDDWDDATSSFVKKVDGHSPNTSGEVSFGLTASKFVKTDTNGHLTTTNDKVITVGSSDSPVNGTYTVVKSVTWSSPNIVIARDQWKFVNGVLVSVTAMANATIGTTVYSGT